MKAYRSGSDFSFMTKGSSATIRPVAFGGRRCRGNEIRLHSHLGECFAGDWAINKNRHMLFGQRFVWVTDCYAAKFILSYDGSNPAILRLQMRLMCWDVDIVHRNDTHLTDADYWSRLGADICFDPMFKSYLDFDRGLRERFAAPTSLPMKPENMPYYRGPRVTTKNASSDATGLSTSPANAGDADHLYCQSIMSAIVHGDCHGLSHLAQVPVRFGTFDCVTPLSSHAALNHEIPATAHRVLNFNWAVYSFGGGHFLSTISSRNLPFCVTLACDQYEFGRALFREFTNRADVFGSSSDLLHHIRSSGDSSQIHGYLIHSLRFKDSETTSKFWQIQATIIAQLRTLRNLQVIVAVIIPDHDGRCVLSFKRTLKAAGWCLSTHDDVSFVDVGDSVAGGCGLLFGIHSSCTDKVEPFQLRAPPPTRPRPLGDFLWEPFSRPEHSVSLARDDDDFCRQDARFSTTPPQDTTITPTGVRIKYFIHGPGSDESSLCGAAVLSTDGLCPPFDAGSNQNLFQHFFGIEFHYADHTHIRGISQFEFASCFGFVDNLTYRLSHPSCKFALDLAIPHHTSAWIFEQLHAYLVFVRDSNCEIFSPDRWAAPAATIQSFVNGAIGTRLPSHSRWVEAYGLDPACTLIRDLVLNPGKICKATLQGVHYIYRGALRLSHIVIEDEMLILREPIRGGTSFTRLQIVPQGLRDIIFVAFHSNPVGGHLDATRTLHRLRMRYHWPEMFSYIKRMCHACPGCALSNPSRTSSSDLVYHFPIEAPFRVLFADAYSAGKHSGFEGSEVYLLVSDGMTGFSIMEPIQHANSTTFASGLMKIQLRFGLCHTIVLDKDSKFFGEFKEAVDLLQINRHVLSGGNHNPMLVERVNRYLNKGLKIMTNERDSVRVAMEAILLLLYAWNSAPIPGTDLSRCFVALGREFQFPIDFSANKHFELTSSPSTISSYSRDLAKRLSALHEVASLLVKEQRAYHREFMNSRRPDPKLFSVGDIVFARRAVRSDAARGQVDKLTYPFTGPWRIVAKLHGASYEIEHCTSKARDKKHASDLSPYPVEIIPFRPLDGADNQFGQLYRRIKEHPYKEAGINGFTPPTPFVVPDHFLTTDDALRFHWPTLAELNEELSLSSSDVEMAMESESLPITTPGMYTGPPPAPPLCSVPPVPSASILAQRIINSADKLFFISRKIGFSIREWRLVRVAFSASTSSYPSCLEDGKYIVDFYSSHPADCRLNAINQRFWLRYHTQEDLMGPCSTCDTHLIRPSDTSEAYASRHHLLPFRQYVNLTHSDTYIHGPFDFATLGGRKTRDRVCSDDWSILRSRKEMFHNSPPSVEVATYSVHVDSCAHTTYHDSSLTGDMSMHLNSETEYKQLYP
jgi:hypothetical protein